MTCIMHSDFSVADCNLYSRCAHMRKLCLNSHYANCLRVLQQLLIGSVSGFHFTLFGQHGRGYTAPEGITRSTSPAFHYQ